ncbi:hypothetical protein CR513_08001, partial [Mucuna pruriens]
MDSYRRNLKENPEEKKREEQNRNDKSASLPTITSEQVGTVIGEGEIVSEKGESTVSAGGSPLLDLSTGDTLKSAEERHKHVPIQRIPNESCTAEHPLLRIPKKAESTNAGVGVSAEELSGVELGEIAVAGLPAPRGELPGVGFVGGEAVPALEDLLAGVVVPRSLRGVADPCSVGIVAGDVAAVVYLECGKGMGCGRGGFELGEKDEDGSEAEK